MSTEKHLKRILSKQSEAASIVCDFAELTNTPVFIRDMDGDCLLSTRRPGPDELTAERAVRCADDAVGYVQGEGEIELVAKLVSYMVSREAEKEDLLGEVLDLYRQINLLFNLSEKLAASLDLGAVAETALREASRLIQGTGGAVILLRGEKVPLIVAATGQGIPPQLDSVTRGGIVGAVVEGEKAEIVNDVTSDSRHEEGRDTIRSLVCAPLLLKGKSLGSVVLVSQEPVTYEAADLKLLNTLASQTAPAIENALLYERALRDAKKREERLKRQVQELRIELDEARQKEKVAEIVGSEYYRRLRERAETLREIIGTQKLS